MLVLFNPIIVKNKFNYRLKLNPWLEQLPVNLKLNEIQLGIQVGSNTIKIEEMKEYKGKHVIQTQKIFFF